jgi:hypothetical protein
MITGVRSALLCDNIEQTETDVNYRGIQSYQLEGLTRPWVFHLWLALQLEIDRKKSSGRVKVYTQDNEWTYPFEIAAGWALGAMAVPLIIPMTREGLLSVAVTDSFRSGKPWRYQWKMAFAEDGRMLTEPEAETMMSDAREAGERLMAPARPN